MEEADNTVNLRKARFPRWLLLSAFAASMAPALSLHGFDGYYPAFLAFLGWLGDTVSDWRSGSVVDWQSGWFIAGYIVVYFLVIYVAVRLLVALAHLLKKRP